MVEVQGQAQGPMPVAERVRELAPVYCLCLGMSNHLYGMRVVDLTALKMAVAAKWAARHSPSRCEMAASSARLRNL